MTEIEFTRLVALLFYSIKCVSFQYWLMGYPADEAIIKAVDALTRKDDSNET